MNFHTSTKHFKAYNECGTSSLTIFHSFKMPFENINLNEKLTNLRSISNY